MLSKNVSCTTDCKPGCECSDGLVENDGDCVDAEECPCYDEETGRIFAVCYLNLDGSVYELLKMT